MYVNGKGNAVYEILNLTNMCGLRRVYLRL